MIIAKYMIWFVTMQFLIVAPALALNFWLGAATSAGCGLALGLLIGHDEDLI